MNRRRRLHLSIHHTLDSPNNSCTATACAWSTTSRARCVCYPHGSVDSIDRSDLIQAVRPVLSYVHVPTTRGLPHPSNHPRQSPKGIALRTMLRSEFRRNANVSEPQQVEQLKMKYVCVYARRALRMLCLLERGDERRGDTRWLDTLVTPQQWIDSPNQSPITARRGGWPTTYSTSRAGPSVSLGCLVLVKNKFRTRVCASFLQSRLD